MINFVHQNTLKCIIIQSMFKIVTIMKLLLLLSLITYSVTISLDCTFNDSTYWQLLPSVYECKANISLTSTNGSVSSVNAVNGHSNDRTNKDVQAVLFRNCENLTFIPQGLTNFFPNLIAINLQECGIEKLFGSELNSYPNLKWFSLYYNKIERVPGNLFAKTPDIIFLSMNNNKIKYVGKDLLEPLGNASWVRFYSNVCVNAAASDASQIPTLVKTLNNQCEDIYEEIPHCNTDVTSERICILERENVKLWEKIANVENALLELK